MEKYLTDEDVLDFNAIKTRARESSRSFKEVIKDLKRDGKFISNSETVPKK